VARAAIVLARTELGALGRAMRNAPLVALVLALGACGGSAGSSSPPPASSTEASGGEAAHPHIFRVAPVGQFHAVFAPLFHAQPGEARASDACANVATLREHAVQIQAVAAPEHVEAAHWTDATAALLTRIDALAAECTSHGPNVEHELDALHEAYHLVHELSEGHDSGTPHYGG